MTLQSTDDNVKRPYNSPRRQSQAEETRTAIIEAALSLFAENGFADTTIRQVADLAEVSEQTVYNTFSDKPGLLYDAGIYAINTGDGGRDDEFFSALQSEENALERIRLAARFGRDQWQEGALELDMMLSSPVAKDPRLEDLSRRVLAYKLEVNLALCRILFPDSVRRRDVSVEQIAAYAAAADSGFTISTLLQFGWSMDDYESWVVTLLSSFLDPDQLEK